MLSVIGSALFIVGSLLFHPELAANPDLYGIAVTSFIAGSALFGGAAALSLRASWRALPRLLAGPTVSAVMALLGGLLYVLGACAFVPAWDSTQGALGMELFQAGNVAYLASSLLGLAQSLRQTPRPVRDCLAHGAYILGAALFICGNVVLAQGRGAAASLAWAVGACCFMLGSGLPLMQTRAYAPTAARL